MGRKSFTSCCSTMAARGSLARKPTTSCLCIRCGACLNHCPIYGAVGGHAYGTTYSGPIGAALNPGLLGVAAAHHQANASTFCGRCAEVCPVKIPLPKIMRYWRAQEFETGVAPKSTVFGLALWAFAAKRPWMYRLVARLAARLLRLRAGATGRVKALPIMGGWFAVRDLRRPKAARFMICGAPTNERARRNSVRHSGSARCP